MKTISNPLGPTITQAEALKIIDWRYKKDEEPSDLEERADRVTQFLKNRLKYLRGWMITNYAEISTPELTKFSSYSTKILQEKIFQPLRDAKISYCYKQYIGTIAICGLVAEMLTLLAWKTSAIKEEAIYNTNEEKIFGKDFEKLDQKVRIRILKAFKIITEPQETLFNKIKDKRNDYLHAWGTVKRVTKEDAYEIYSNTIKLLRLIVNREESQFQNRLRKLK